MTAQRPTVADLPPVEAFTAIENHVSRIQGLNHHARAIGTLPRPHAHLRAVSVEQALEGRSRKVAWLADQVNLTPSRICQLLRLAQKIGAMA